MSAPAQSAPRVKVLPDHVANQIAAGEVVERPASVVKELVENALDAGASDVRVTVEQGGKGRIRVADDGIGMIRQDVLACLDRHATSKIRQAADLRDIRTLGFRGEALPSIAAVSRMTIETAARGDDAGTRVRVLAGKIQSVEDAARRPGTTVDVRNLFLNTPVRARFLRNVGVETRAVSEVLHSLALANLDTRLVLETNGRGRWDLPAGRSLAERVAEIWEDAGLIPVSAAGGGLRLEGVLQRPDRARPGFRRALLFANGRPFRDGRLIAAADRGYRTTVPEGARAWLFLFLSLPSSQVDVNVHPGKAEVRFRDPAQVEDFLEEAVRDTLQGVDSAASWGEAPAAPNPPAMVRETPSSAPPMRLFGRDDEGEGDDGARGPAVDPPDPADALVSPTPKLALLQVHNSFILAETRDGLLIVDQHAAHERILYERIMARFQVGAAEGQRLLFPFTVRMTPQELDTVKAVSALLNRLGFEIEPFGSGALLVQAVPSPHAHFDAERCIREMIRELAEGSDLTRAARNQNERVAMSFACKGAIKAGQKLAPEEMQDLFDQLFATRLPYHDVHGRPTVVRLGLGELKRKFGRSS